MNCLRNEIDHISKKSIEHNNSPMTVHGQFQNIVGKIDEILNGNIVYESPNYWHDSNKLRNMERNKNDR